MRSKRICIANFYSFFANDNLDSLKCKIAVLAKKYQIKGSVILATEGINCSLAGDCENIKETVTQIKNLTPGTDWMMHLNYANFNPFLKLKIRIKTEIVSLGVPDLKVEDLRGKYVSPKEWQDFISQSDVVLIDVRNNYEFEMGHFDNAMNPKTENFRDFSSWLNSQAENFKNKKVAMYCTGGVRCEKATAYLKKHLNFSNAYQLQGGILEYLRQCGENNDSAWKGECFVFDDRVSVNTTLKAKQEIPAQCLMQK
jgi:UPF0176 protein